MMKLALLFLCCVLLVGCASHKLSWQSPYTDIGLLKDGDIVHLPTGVMVDKEKLFDLLDGAKVVYVGETHDNINAHRMQLEILQALYARRPGKVAVGMEMLKRPSQQIADQWSEGALEEKELVRTWIDDWTNDFANYRDILLYIRDHKIPLVALRASDAWVNSVKKIEPQVTADNKGGETEPEDALPEMDFGDAYHRSHIEAVFKKHPMHSQGFEDFYKVQVLWDESMAQSIYDYLVTEEGQDKQMIIFAGAQHVEHGFGIPRRVFRRLASPYKIVVPITLSPSPEKKPKTMGLTLPEVPLFPGDFAWAVNYEELDDEKVYLGVIIDSTEEGVKILRTTKGSVAEKVGLQKNDIFSTFDGEKIETSFDLTYLIRKKKPGDTGVVEVLRDQKILRFEVVFEKGGFHM